MQSTEHTVSSQQASTGIILIDEEKTGRGEDLKEGNKRNKNGGWRRKRRKEESGGRAERRTLKGICIQRMKISRGGTI